MAMKITTSESFPPFVKILRTTKGGTGKELAIAMNRVWNPTWYQLEPYAKHFGFRIWSWKDGVQRYRFVSDETYVDLCQKTNRELSLIEYDDLRSVVRKMRATKTTTKTTNGTETGTANASAKPSRKGRGKGRGTGTETETETATA